MTKIKFFLLFLFFNLTINITAVNALPDEMVESCGEMTCDVIFSKMRKFAKGGSPHAQAVLALFYRNGYITDVNTSRSLKFMKKAAKAGLAYAQYDLSLVYRNGYLVEKDEQKSDHWLQRSGKAGYKPALKLLISENKISNEEKIAYEKKTRQATLEKDDEVLTVFRDKYTLTDLAELLASLGYGRSKATGSRINGQGCGKGMANCSVVKVNSLLGRTQFANVISVFNTGETGRRMATMIK